jgi:predicted RNase H-like nuclease
MGDLRVLGVDGCKAGWVGIALSDGCVVRAHFAATIADLVGLASQAGPLDVVGVDMPIGLADAGIRRADMLARGLAGPRRASVFLTPVRAAVECGDYAAASAISVRLTGQGISRQSYALRGKILELDEWTRVATVRVAEVHPELSFAGLAGAPLASSKATWAGATTRRRLLAAAGIGLPDELGLAGAKAGMDDVLDAAAVAWTALRIARGEARSVPDPPERFSDGLPAAIWT